MRYGRNKKTIIWTLSKKMLNRCALYGNNGLGGTVRTKQVAGCGTFVVSQKSSNRDLGKGGKRKKPWVIADSGLL